MSSLFFENPFLVGLIGTIVFCMSIYGWIQTGNSWAGRAAIVSIILTAILVWLNLWIETDGETIRKMLSESALEVQENQIAKLKRRVHPDASERVHQSMSQLPNFQFSEARITQIHAIEFSEVASRKVAFVRMNVIAEAESKMQSTAGIRGKQAAWLQLELEQLNGQWCVVDCERQNPQHELLRHSP